MLEMSGVISGCEKRRVQERAEVAESCWNTDRASEIDETGESLICISQGARRHGSKVDAVVRWVVKLNFRRSRSSSNAEPNGSGEI